MQNNKNRIFFKKKSYGSQRPVVVFTVARGQYDPNGQAKAKNKHETQVIQQDKYMVSTQIN